METVKVDSELKADIEAITMAQMLSGLTMQLLDHSRAASGAEHLIAHLVEMKPPRFEKAEGIHGECVGVGTYLCAKKYHELAKLTPKAKPFEPLTIDWINEKFGPRLAAGIAKENANDILATFDPQNIVDRWEDITLYYKDGKSAHLTAVCDCATDRQCVVYGTKGCLKVDNSNNPKVIKLYDDPTSDTPTRVLHVPEQITGFEYQVNSCIRALEKGELECPEMPHAEIIRIMEMMDQLRSDWGMVYPFD